MFQHIVLAVDGSEPSLRAAEVAGRLAAFVRGRLCVVVAFDPVPDVLGRPYWEEAVSKRLEEAQSVLEMALARLPEPDGVDLDTEVLQGSPAEVILTVAREHKADLIVMGARGRGGLAALLLGSQAQKVVAHAPCPVLLVP